MNEQTEETKGRNEENDQDEDSLADREEGQDVEEYFGSDREKWFLKADTLEVKRDAGFQSE